MKIGNNFIRSALVVFVALFSFSTVTLPAQAIPPTLLLAGNDWLGGQGVSVCDGSTEVTCNNEAHVGGWSGNWWQCVELAQRLYKKHGWHGGIFGGVSYAYQIYDNASTLGMTRQANGSITSIVPGDMIIHGPDPYPADAGHVSIVDSVSGSTVNVVEQNTYNDQPRATYSFANGTLTRSGTGTIKGIVHDADNLNTNTSTPLPPPAYVIVRNGGNLYRSDGGSGWQLMSNSATAGFWTTSGSRIVNQDANGLWVKDGSANWSRWGNGDSHEIQASSSLVVVRNGSNLYSHDGSTGWQHISNTATQGLWKVVDDRIVNQDANGLWVKDGSANWSRWGNGDSHEIQVSQSRIVVRNGASLYTSTNGAGWEHISNSATQGFWKLSGDRVVNQDANGLWIKDVNSGWTQWGGGGSDEIQVSGNLIVVRSGGNLYSSNGSSGWQLISNSATAGFWTLTGARVVNQDANGLWVKDGNAGWVRWGNGDSHEIKTN